MSPRHLQRGLAREGTTFHALLDQARRELAIRYLAAPRATVAQGAWLVGVVRRAPFIARFSGGRGIRHEPAQRELGKAAMTDTSSIRRDTRCSSLGRAYTVDMTA